MEHRIVFSGEEGGLWVPPEKGFVEGLPAAMYHGTHGRASNNGLKKLLKSPAHFAASITGKDAKDTPALRFGRIVHLAILEPTLFLAHKVVAPEFKGTGSKAAKAEWEKRLPPNSIILDDAEEEARITGMLNRLLAHRVAANLLKTGVAEVSGFWTDPETGVKCRIRPDYLRKGPMVLDYKTTEDASYEEFRRSAYFYGYPLQAAFYCEGVSQILGKRCDDFVFIAQEKAAPYELMVYPADEGFLDFGRRQMRKALRTFAECQRTGAWPGYPEQPVNLGLPPYADFSEGD